MANSYCVTRSIGMLKLKKGFKRYVTYVIEIDGQSLLPIPLK